MYSNPKLVSDDELIALYEPLFLKMKKYGENSIKLSENNAYKYFKRIAGNCNKKAIPEEVYFPLAVKHLDFKTYGDEATEATEEAYRYEDDWGTWLNPSDKVGDPNNPMHQKGPAKRKNDAQPEARLSKEDYESIVDIIRTTLLDYVPLLCGSENLDKKSISIFQFMAKPRTIEEIMSYGESIGANESQVDFIFTYLNRLDLIDDGEGDTYIQKSL
jgi:hypothetical protein